MTPHHPPAAKTAAATVALLLTVAIVTAAGCGSDQPRSAARSSDFEALERSPAPLKRLYARANRILDGGAAAFRRQIAALDGHAVVVNKWASWCGPCRLEFPFFQRQARKHGGRIAFLGVDSRDNREDAGEFLARFPVPYPSFFDPKGEVAAVFRGERVFPASAFYDSNGKLVFTKQGGYASEAALAKDIARYAR